MAPTTLRRQSDEIANFKKKIINNPEALQKSYERLTKVLAEELPQIGPDSIAEIDFADLQQNEGQFDELALAKLKKSGVLIVRKIFSTEQAEQWNKELIDYLESNGKTALKPKSLNLHDSYWSKPQIQARHHPNMILLQKALNGLWNKKAGIDDCVDLTKLLTYNDRLRMRNPGHHSFLYPHLDNGTISRWSDSVSQETFKQIFDGQWEDYDPFCVNGRGFTRFDGTCTFFRYFKKISF